MSAQAISNIQEQVSFRESEFYSPLDGWDAALINNAKVMVIGAGALGNEVLKNLALVGVKNILISDFDIIEPSNLAKSLLYRKEDCEGNNYKVEVAARRLRELAPDLKLMTINGDATIDIGLGVYREMDVIISCLDNRLTRRWVNRFCYALGKTWVDAGIGELSGQVDVYNREVNCYECGLGKQAINQIAFREGCVNRMQRYATAGLATTNILSASLTAAVQTQEALKIIAKPSQALSGTQFFFDGRGNYYDTLGKAAPRRKECKSHQVYSPIIEAEELSAHLTIGEVIQWLENHFGTQEVSILLHYILVTGLRVEGSEAVIPFIKPRNHIQEEDLDAFRNTPREQVKFENWTDELTRGFPDLTLSLNQVGVPPYHILTVVAEGRKHFVCLAGDKDFVKFT